MYMARPRLSVETFESDLQWFGTHGQRKWFARLGHAVVGTRQRPRIDAGAEVGSNISSLLADDTRLVLAANHPTGPRDTEVIAAVPQLYEPLKPIIGSTKIMAAAKLFEARDLKAWLRAHVMTALGAYPVINTDLYPDLSEERRQELRQTHAEFSASQLHQGWHLAMFPEGDKDRTGNPLHVRTVRPGLRHILEHTASITPVAIVPIGMYYPVSGVNAYIGQPLVPRDDLAAITSQLQLSLQVAVDNAAQMG